MNLESSYEYMRVRCICMQIVHHYSRHVKSHSRVQDLLESPSGKIFSNLQQSCNKENPEQFVVVFCVKGGCTPDPAAVSDGSSSAIHIASPALFLAVEVTFLGSGS